MKGLVKNRIFIGFLCITVLLVLTNCGTLLFPERCGQPLKERGHPDPAVVILDACLLLFFIVPGVIAFAVDISDGALYLPKSEMKLHCPSRFNLSLKVPAAIDGDLEIRIVDSQGNVLVESRPAHIEEGESLLKCAPIYCDAAYIGKSGQLQVLTDGVVICSWDVEFIN